MAKKVKISKESEDVLCILQKFGKYQILQYLYICLPTIFIAMGNVNYVFVAGDVDYRCRVPECEAVDQSFSPSWWPHSREPLDSKLSRCYRPVLNETYSEQNECHNSSFTNNFRECEEWVYDSNNTIVSWLNLGCNPWKTNSVGTIHSLGSVIGMSIGGGIADRIGRKTTFIATSVAIIVGNVKTFILSYYGYLIIELLESIISGAAFATGMILIIEISGNDHRILSGVVFAYSIYVGEALLTGIAILLPFWKYIIYTICLPPVLFTAYIGLLEESPRWLVLHDKLDKAKRILKLISRSNKININIDLLDKIGENELKNICNVEMEPRKEGYKEAFLSLEVLKRLLIATVARFSVSLIYYGLVANSVWLPGNKYTNYALTTVMSFPGDIFVFYTMNRWGRRIPLVFGYIVCGAACIASAYVPETYMWLKIILYMAGKLSAAACFTGIWTYTMELFPTSIRGSMFGLCTLIASPGSMLAPLAPAMDTISPMFASIFFACSAVTTSVLLLFAPETNGQPLAGTIQDITKNIKTGKGINEIDGEDNFGFNENSINVKL